MFHFLLFRLTDEVGKISSISYGRTYKHFFQYPHDAELRDIAIGFYTPDRDVTTARQYLIDKIVDEYNHFIEMKKTMFLEYT